MDVADAVGWELLKASDSRKDDVKTFAIGEFSEVMALKRTFVCPVEKPSGRRLEEMKSQIMKLRRRASGHTSPDNLSKLLERRGAPDRPVSLAKELKCPDCQEDKRSRFVPPSSTEKPPGLWDLLGLDVFEYEHIDNATSASADGKFLAIVSRASRLSKVVLLKKHPAREFLEPTTSEIKSAFIRGWMGTNPAPIWLLTEAVACFTSPGVRGLCPLLARR